MNAILRNIGSGIAPSLLALAYAVTYGALIFSGPMQPYMAHGVGAALIGGAVVCFVLAPASGFKPIVAGPEGATVALLAAMATVLGPSLAVRRPADAVALIMLALAGATLLAGIGQFVLGRCRLGTLVRYIPYPVVAGFLGSTAWLLISGAARMATGVAIGPALIGRLAAPGIGLEFLLTVLWAAGLWALGRRVRHPMAVPAALILATLAAHLALRALGLSIDTARAKGFLFDRAGAAGGSLSWHALDLAGLPWSTLLSLSGDMAAMVLVSVIAILLNSTGIEVATRTEIDLDRELRLHGIANLLVAFCFGFVANISITRTLASRATGGDSRLPGWVVGAFMLAVALSGVEIAAYLPRFVLSGLLLQMGLSSFWAWGLASFRRLPFRDWLTVVVIIVLTALFGTLWGLLYGVIACCVLLALDVGRIDMVRHAFGLNERSSSRLRAAEEMRILARDGHRVQVLVLDGFIFFGSAHRLHERVKTIVQARRPQVIVIDFSAVDGMDSSAGASFAKIDGFLRAAGIALVATGLGRTLLPLLREALALAGDLDGAAALAEGRVLDEVLEIWEDRLLVESDLDPQAPVVLTEWLAQALGGAEHGARLAARLRCRTLKGDAYLCRQGDPTDALLFVQAGRISVLLEEPGTPPLRLRVFGPRTVLGEVGFFLDTPRTASLRSDMPSIVWSLSRADFTRLVHDAPATVTALFTYIVALQSERLAFSTRQIAALRR